MKRDLRKELREASFVKGKEKTWVSKLSDSQLHEIFLRFKNGETVNSIARHFKRTYPQLKGSSVSSLSKGLMKYKYRIIRLLEWEFPADESKDLNDLGRIEQLESLSDKQLNRISALMKAEQEGNIINVSISKEIDSLTEFQKTIIKAKKSRPINTKPDYSGPSCEEWSKATTKKAKEMTDNMTEQDKIQCVITGIERFATLFEVNSVTSMLGKEIQDAFFKRFPWIGRIDIVTEKGRRLRGSSSK